MEVSVHYRGLVADIRKIKSICEELSAIADKMKRRCTLLDEDWSQPADATIEIIERGSYITGHLPLKGIALKLHPKCETRRFLFDSNGILRDPVSMADGSKYAFEKEDEWISVKTQYAGAETHIWIIGILKYLKKRYLPDLAVEDEGGYWETGNVEALKEKLNFIDEKIASIKAELSRVIKGHILSYSIDELASMIEALLHDKLG